MLPDLYICFYLNIILIMPSLYLHLKFTLPFPVPEIYLHFWSSISRLLNILFPYGGCNQSRPHFHRSCSSTLSKQWSVHCFPGINFQSPRSQQLSLLTSLLGPTGQFAFSLDRPDCTLSRSHNLVEHKGFIALWSYRLLTQSVATEITVHVVGIPGLHRRSEP